MNTKESVKGEESFGKKGGEILMRCSTTMVTPQISRSLKVTERDLILKAKTEKGL